jgi:hypothetical protein
MKNMNKTKSERAIIDIRDRAAANQSTPDSHDHHPPT